MTNTLATRHQIYLALGLLPLLSGCGKDMPPGPLCQVMTTWDSGDQDGAMQLLLSIDWNQPDLADGARVLSMSEAEFSSYYRNKRNRIQNEAIPAAETIKQVGWHAISLGAAAQAAGNRQEADSYYEAAMNLGEFLSNPAGLYVIQNLGDAILTKAGER